MADNRVMRGERWAALQRKVPDVAELVASAAAHVKNALIDVMRVEAKLERARRGGGYDPDIAAALDELEGVKEALERHFAVAMARLPAKARGELAAARDAAAEVL